MRFTQHPELPIPIHPSLLTPNSSFGKSLRDFFCQVKIFAQKISCGKNHDPQKSGKWVECRRFFLCQSHRLSTSQGRLWKTLVENSVENVENYEFSTGILTFPTSPPPCGKPGFPGLHNTGSGCLIVVLRYRQAEVSSCQKREKKLVSCEKMLSKTIRSRAGKNIFC